MNITEENKKMLGDMNKELNGMEDILSTYIHSEQGLSLLCTLQDYKGQMPNKMVNSYLDSLNVEYEERLIHDYLGVGFIEQDEKNVLLTKKGEMFIDFMVLKNPIFEKKYSER